MATKETNRGAEDGRLQSYRGIGALNQGWQRWQAGYDYVAGIDADTVLAPDCLQQLETELASTPRPGGVMARYTFEQRLGHHGHGPDAEAFPIRKRRKIIDPQANRQPVCPVLFGGQVSVDSNLR